MQIEYPSELAYKGYIGEVEYDPSLGVFLGCVRALKGNGFAKMITFRAHSVEAITNVFSDAVDDYLKMITEKEGENG